METNSNLHLMYESEWDEDLRTWLEKYIADHPHHDTSVLSRSQYIGIPRGVLDSYLKKNYFRPRAWGGEGNDPAKSKVEPAIRAYRDKIGGTDRDEYGKHFFETGTWKQMRNALKIALDERAIIVVYGKPGVGKSKTLNEFALREMRTAPIIILCSRNVTTSYFVECIARELNIKYSGSIPAVEEAIWKKLQKHPRAIFVDQANYLGERSYGSLCLFWERAKIPIALTGTRDLFNSFMRSTMTEDVRAQLTSRIAIHYLLPKLELAEVKAIVKHTMGDRATDEMISQIYRITGGIYRNVEMLLARISDLEVKNKQLLDAKEIDMSQIIDVAGSRLMIA